MSISTPNYPPGTVMEVSEAFACDLDGRNVVMIPGVDRVTADHELVRRFPRHFRPVEPQTTYDVEAATDIPGERRVRSRPAVVARNKTVREEI